MKKKMPKAKTKIYRQKLLGLKEGLLEKIRGIEKDAMRNSQKDAAADLSAYTLHMADVATDSYDREFSLGLATEEQKIIYEIDDALKRVESGEYGICMGCEKPIPQRRLNALPYAKHCIKCQKDKESAT